MRLQQLFAKTKVAVVERRAGAKALKYRMVFGAMSELEISWASEKREKLEEEDFGKKLEREPEPPLPNEEEREQKYHLMIEKLKNT
jgi:hypothetical protein